MHAAVRENSKIVDASFPQRNYLNLKPKPGKWFRLAKKPLAAGKPDKLSGCQSVTY